MLLNDLINRWGNIKDKDYTYCNFRDKYNNYNLCSSPARSIYIWACKFHAVKYIELNNGKLLEYKIRKVRPYDSNLKDYGEVEKQMEVKSIEVDADLYKSWFNKATTSLNDLYQAAYDKELLESKDELKAKKAGLEALTPRIREIEHLQFQARTEEQAAQVFIKDKLGSYSKSERDKLITIPDFKVETKAPVSKLNKEEKVQNAMAGISSDKLMAMRTKLAEMKARREGK